MAAPVDQDWDFLDRVIALALDIIDLSNEIKDISDDLDVLHRALKQEAAALIIQKVAKDYRPRLRRLKELENNPYHHTTGSRRPVGGILKTK